MGAHITTILQPKRGTITDFDGVFVIGDGRYGESWEVGHIGNESQVFVLDRNVSSGNFVLKDKAFQLNEVIVTPRTPATATPPIVADNPFIDYSQQLIDSLNNKKPTKKGLWDTIKDNPVLGIGLGVLGALGVGALLAQVAKASDKVEQKRLATAK